jgi:hypothetical protein
VRSVLYWTRTLGDRCIPVKLRSGQSIAPARYRIVLPVN